MGRQSVEGFLEWPVAVVHRERGLAILVLGGWVLRPGFWSLVISVILWSMFLLCGFGILWGTIRRQWP